MLLDGCTAIHATATLLAEAFIIRLIDRTLDVRILVLVLAVVSGVDDHRLLLRLHAFLLELCVPVGVESLLLLQHLNHHVIRCLFLILASYQNSENSSTAM